jgi:hypothetical protein
MTDTKTTSLPNKAYGAATTALREAHREEFDALLTAEYAKVGLTRKVRRTAEQIAAEKVAAAEAKAAQREAARREKALATAQALQAEFPDLLTVKSPSLDAQDPDF